MKKNVCNFLRRPGFDKFNYTTPQEHCIIAIREQAVQFPTQELHASVLKNPLKSWDPKFSSPLLLWLFIFKIFEIIKLSPSGDHHTHRGMECRCLHSCVLIECMSCSQDRKTSAIKTSKKLIFCVRFPSSWLSYIANLQCWHVYRLVNVHVHANWLLTLEGFLWSKKKLEGPLFFRLHITDYLDDIYQSSWWV